MVWNADENVPHCKGLCATAMRPVATVTVAACCTACCATNPQQIKTVELEPIDAIPSAAFVLNSFHRAT